jgi:hypothetical protein
MKRKNLSLKNKFGSVQKDGGACIDQIRNSTAENWDWAPTTGHAFRVHGPTTGEMKLNEGGSPYIVKKKK